MVFFLLAVFFVPFVVITASYLAVTVRVWRFSGAHRSVDHGERCDATSVRQARFGCPDCEANVVGDGEDDEAQTMETGAEYEMKVLSRGDSRNRRNECRMNEQVKRHKDLHNIGNHELVVTLAHFLQEPSRYCATTSPSTATPSSQVRFPKTKIEVIP